MGFRRDKFVKLCIPMPFEFEILIECSSFLIISCATKNHYTLLYVMSTITIEKQQLISDSLYHLKKWCRQAFQIRNYEHWSNFSKFGRRNFYFLIIRMDASIPYETPISDYRRNERQEMIVATPLDLSFKKATTMNELASKRPQAVRTGKIPLRTATDRFLTCSLWLSNNLLTSMDGLENLAHKVLDDPTYLSWLDLAFNEIEHIGDDITKFPNLKILYLHGNNISDISGVVKLRTLQNLRSLTVHGNPIENVPYYRGYIVHVLPQLTMLDFSAILSAERKKAAPAGFHRIMHDST